MLVLGYPAQQSVQKVSYCLVTVDQKGQLEKERTLESSAWLTLIMSSDDFTLETIALSFFDGSSYKPF